MSRRCDLDDVAARRQLSARKMDLEHAEISGLRKCPSPGPSVDLVGAAIESDRVRAIGHVVAPLMPEPFHRPPKRLPRLPAEPIPRQSRIAGPAASRDRRTWIKTRAADSR
jgi:hypothetical protein